MNHRRVVGMRKLPSIYLPEKQAGWESPAQEAAGLVEEALGSVRCSHSSLQRPDKLRTATTTPQHKARSSRFIFLSLHQKIQPDTKINLDLKLYNLSFGLGSYWDRYFALSRQNNSNS